MQKTLSTQFFLISMALILFLGSGGIYLSSYFLNHKFPDLNQQDEKYSNVLGSGPVTRKPTAVSLNLSSPDNNILVFSPDLLIQGKTTPGSVVIITTYNNDQTVDTNKDGNFSLTLKLKEGVNNVLISTFDSLGNADSQSRTIYYSPDKL